jgi:hypothetical protein
MSVHDAYARLTPYELTFPDLESARTHFRAIRQEADAREVELRDPSAFVMLASTGQALREIRGPEDDPALIRQYGLLIYHSFHFFEVGEPLHLIEATALRELLDGDPDASGWTPRLDPAAGYLQLPQHLVWVRSSGDAPPESLDGFFWTRSGPGQFDLLLALGMRGDRPGLSVVPLSDLPIADVGEWVGVAMREHGVDFSSSLPGSEIEGLYELRSAGEALKLAARALWRLEHGPLERRPPSEAAGGPRPSELPYHRAIAATPS